MAGMALVTTLACTGCAGDTKPHGEAALKGACEGVLDSETINEARKSEEFDSLHVASGPRSHAAAVKSMTEKRHAAYVCLLDDNDSSKDESGALSIKFSPGQGRLFSEDETRSYSTYKVYKLGNDMQAISESGGADVYFQCDSSDRFRPLFVTGGFQSDLDLSNQAKFRTLFQSSRKMVKLLKCENEIKFPDPATMKYLPLKKN
ncbi:hypothetical protein [Streptomyces sp. SID4982]|uniref:hypothetical protein n=1 Tax=Streptomyces sp. SID4982 TaxID=2690291 RepID=UPI001367CCBA|nr:hypothetical protein [Streptomyces sp. SID4982]MYS18331.1 hypothetical protein [Streptomyces sp. SID4982]